MTVEPDLARLATAHGVATSYDDQLRRPVDVSRDSVVAVLAAMGVDASSTGAISESLAALDRRSDVPPVVVLRRSKGAAVRVGGPALVRLADGTHRAVAVDGGRVSVPPGLPLGWHVLETAGREIPLAVTPDRLPALPHRAWGWMVQLYALRSARSWGVGDIGDLATLATWTARRDGDLVLVNPLHAVAPGTPMQPSPYYPASRRWTNPLYLRVEDLEAYAAAPPQIRAEVDALRVPSEGERIDRDRSWEAKQRALELLSSYAGLSADVDTGIDTDLRDFATWCALAEVHGSDWRTWPPPLRRPETAAVGAARHELASRVRFHAWLQQLCDVQLARVQAHARDAGMTVGIVHDLAVGTDPAGADAWAWQDVLALGARIGAPPDTFNQQGQDWGMPPWHPQRLAGGGYRPVREMLRGLLRHAGGVRIDHALGLFRMWWIPDGAGAADGTYVSYDADALLGVIALEAAQAGALVVGEDLGTVPPTAARALADRGVLGSSVLWFEREEAPPGETGPLRAPAEWRPAAMASVTTHDLPTALGWLRGEHVRVRAELGLLDDPVREQASWEAERAELLAHLHAAGVLPDPATASEEELVGALHRFLARTPSVCVVGAPADAVGDLRQPNLPGTVDDYPNWRLPVADAAGRPMRLEELLADPRVESLAADLAAGVR